MKASFYVLLLALIIQTPSCGRSPEHPSEGEIQIDSRSPDDLTRAFVLLPRLEGMGATVSQPYQVWLQDLKSGQEALVLEADKTDGLYLEWKDKNLVLICYASAQINTFHNAFVVANERSPQIRVIEVALNRVQRLSECQ